MRRESGYAIALSVALGAIAACAGNHDGATIGARPATRLDAGEPRAPVAVVEPDGGPTTTSSPEAAPGSAPDSTTPQPSGCIDSVAAGHRTFHCEGIVHDVEVSAACALGGCGVILDVHGLTMNGGQEELGTTLRASAPARGFIVVQPTAPSGLLGPSWTPVTDDDKVWRALGALRKAFLVDPRRVHVTGFSQGGSMSYRLACAHANEIASVAPVAPGNGNSLANATPPFEIDCPFDAQRSPARALPILHLHGKRDGLSPIAKGRQQRDLALAWLGATSEVVVAEDASYKWTRYGNPAGAVFEFIEHDYEAPSPALPIPIGGHCMPGGTDLQVTAPLKNFAFTCVPPTAFAWGEVLVDFFVAHPLP